VAVFSIRRPSGEGCVPTLLARKEERNSWVSNRNKTMNVITPSGVFILLFRKNEDKKKGNDLSGWLSWLAAVSSLKRNALEGGLPVWSLSLLLKSKEAGGFHLIN